MILDAREIIRATWWKGIIGVLALVGPLDLLLLWDDQELLGGVARIFYFDLPNLLILASDFIWHQGLLLLLTRQIGQVLDDEEVQEVEDQEVQSEGVDSGLEQPNLIHLPWTRGNIQFIRPPVGVLVEA